MSSEFELSEDGEIICKYADRRDVIVAMKRAIAKNDPEMTAAAYDGDEDDEHDEHGEDDEDETELSPRERTRRGRKLIQNARESARQARTKRDLPMIDPDVVIAQVSKAGLGLAVVKRFAETGAGDELTEHQIVKLAMGELGAAAFSKLYQSDDELGRMLRTATTKARNAQWAGAYKTRAAGDGNLGVRALGGREAFAVGRGSQGSKPTEADKVREAAIEQQMRLGRWKTVEDAARYVDGLQAELNRMARAKQQRSRPGTLDRV
jgi:hypothetical protein